MDDMQSYPIDYLVVSHFDGREEKVSLPPSETPIRVGRETDNDVVLSDPRCLSLPRPGTPSRNGIGDYGCGQRQRHIRQRPAH